MTEQLRDIGRRLSALRGLEEISPEEFARKTGVSLPELLAYERGEADFSFSFLSNAAAALGVDVVDLLTGDSPRLSSCCITRAGEGFAIDRRKAYSYKHLAFTFRKKLADPFLVTVEPKEDAPVLHTHEGQEFDYLLSGRMRLFVGEISYELAPGDSAYFDAGQPHAMRALDGAPAVFLAVVMKGGAPHGAV